LEVGIISNSITVIILIPIALLSYWVSAIIHELGHILVGMAHGWKFYWLVVGFIGLKRKDGKLSLYLEKNPALWGGVGGTVPAEESEHNIKTWSKILLGGPIASIVTGVLFLCVCLFYFNLIWLMLGLMPIAMGVACLLPLQTGITYTDGKRWRRLHAGGTDEAEEVALFKMTERDWFGKDKSSLNLDDFKALLDAKLPALRYYGNYYLYQYHDICNDVVNRDKALEALNNIKKSVPKIIVDECQL
jgi:hypothetical protein